MAQQQWSSSYHVGQRVSFESAPCTIRYIGPVEGTQKEWLGVEWDDPTRGKHDGEHKGIRYFSCGCIYLVSKPVLMLMLMLGRSKSKTSASFVRPTRVADATRSFVEAVHQKYASEFIEQNTSSNEGAQVVISGKVAEEVGFDKIRAQLAQLHELKIVLVDGLKIDSAELETKKIRDVCPKIVELDLSRNLFMTCKEIIQICGELDKLTSVRLKYSLPRQLDGRMLIDNSGNRISIRSEVLESCQDAFRGIAELGLDAILLTWQDLCHLAQQFVSLTALTASFNEFTSLPMGFIPQATVSNLTSLTLEHNQFTSLSDLAPLCELEHLERLLLKGNQIQEIGPQDSPAPLKFPQTLRYVDLSYNNVTSWRFIDSLPTVLPGLTGLRFSQNPIYQTPSSSPDSNSSTSIEEGFMITVARLASLQFLNFSKIAPTERTNAEMFYLSRIGKELAAVPETEEWRVLEEHRRYKELCDIYDPPTVVRATATSINPNFLEARLIKFTFVLPSGTTTDQGPLEKLIEIPKSFEIYRVKGMVGRRFGLKPLGMKLIWETGEWDPVAGYEDEENSDDEDDNVVEVERRITTGDTLDDTSKGKWMKREVELEDSTRQVGFVVDGMEARVRIELR
jgi:hypothetical protein